MAGRWDGAEGLFVGDALGIHQRFVQVEEGVAEGLEALFGVGHLWGR